MTLHEWRGTFNGTSYLISTNPALVSIDFVNDAFGSRDMYWATALPLPALQTMLRNSIVLGVYEIAQKFPDPRSVSEPSTPRTPSPTLDAAGVDSDSEELSMVGMARFATDFVLLMYLSDVYIQPEHRGKGVSTWLIECCKDLLDSMPHLRRLILFAAPGKSEHWYANMLDCYNVQRESEHLACMTRFTGGTRNDDA